MALKLSNFQGPIAQSDYSRPVSCPYFSLTRNTKTLQEVMLEFWSKNELEV